MDPKPQQPATPAPTGPATKSTVYDDHAPQQPGPVVPAPNLPDPTPDPAPAAATPDPAQPPVPPTPEPEEADGEEALTDPTTPVQPDTSGETDPGASATNDAHPL
ncbi:hypothetical protein [Hymenobacter persicinus]|uniref:Uncharacterized protein n=1 Tax=Hymenobacter persicinus TaxID=2025506 RepID=A0A4Q5LE49_9BACT|nr:hypothetical protein [Hymenobacter persicinus]RYU81859.1 hypothetical protein EWM57_05615 [Hymenobacter persicinus]